MVAESAKLPTAVHCCMILSLGYSDAFGSCRRGKRTLCAKRHGPFLIGESGCRSFNPARPSLNQIAFLGEKFQFPRPVVSFCSRLPPVSIYPVYASFLPPICVCFPYPIRRDRYYNAPSRPPRRTRVPSPFRKGDDVRENPYRPAIRSNGPFAARRRTVTVVSPT